MPRAKRKYAASYDEADHYDYYYPVEHPSHAAGDANEDDDDGPLDGKKRKKKKTKAASASAATSSSANDDTRLARFKAKCPKNILERLERVRGQRFFLISRERQGTELAETFTVLGSTGNVYTVKIDHVPSCNCPDALKGNHCKHILFVFLRVLGQPAESPNIYQKALLTSELQDVFGNAPPDPTSTAHNPDAIQAWHRATGTPMKAQASGSSSQTQVKTEDDDDKERVAQEEPAGKRRLPTEEDTCPVCYEDIFGEDLSYFVFCSTGCGGPVHKECFSNWANTTQAQGKSLTCVYCREPWTGPEAGAKGKGRGGRTAAATMAPNPDALPSYQEGYLNLASAVGISSFRDTSSYYHGPRSGMTQREAYWYALERYGGSGYTLG